MHKDIENRSRNHSDLVLGQVDFINCLPINLPFGSLLERSQLTLKIVSGVPSKLCEMMINGEIDIAPVSSLFYLENKDKFIPVGDLCIASDGPADSVLLFSKFPVEELHGAKIALTYASRTSNKLLEIILKEFLGTSVRFDTKDLTLDELTRKYPACLFIGDHALYEYSKQPRNIFIYDLGTLWKKHTGLPMVFGLWVSRKEIIEKYPKEIKLIASLLREAKEIGLGWMFETIIKKAQDKILLSKEFYTTYFEHLNYELTDEYKKGLERFEESCIKLPAMAPSAA